MALGLIFTTKGLPAEVRKTFDKLPGIKPDVDYSFIPDPQSGGKMIYETIGADVARCGTKIVETGIFTNPIIQTFTVKGEHQLVPEGPPKGLAMHEMHTHMAQVTQQARWLREYGKKLDNEKT